MGNRPWEKVSTLSQRRRKNHFKKVKAQRRDMLIDAGLWFCWHCGSTEGLTLHHLQPIEFNGSNDQNNMMCLCEDCHKVLHKIFKIGWWNERNNR